MQKVRIVLQARMNSSRLPAKMMMPVGGLPLVNLCVQRVSRNSDYELVVATSVEQSDDALVDVLKKSGISFCRGPLDDVLSRFVLAAEGLGDSDLIVRLTGDNPVVDSDFVLMILDDHKKSGARYTRSLSPFDGLPYGVSAEVIEVGLLRRLSSQNPTAFEREHVTIYYTERGEYRLFKSPLGRDLSHLRVTIDTPEDYDCVVKLFDQEDAVNVSWCSLIKKLTATNSAFRTPYRKVGLKAQSIFALGTAQLGLPYGIANKTGQPTDAEAKAIVEMALNHGVTWIDTAAAYGVSEKVLGRCLSIWQKQDAVIVTKLSPNSDTIESAIHSIEKSRVNLGLDVLPYVLLHRWVQRKSPAWEALIEMKNKGIIRSLGVSVQSPEEGLLALRDMDIKFIQIPFNIIDGRWKDFAAERYSRSDVHIQARSTLLQGVLTLPYDQWPTDLHLARDAAERLQAIAIEEGRKSVADLCYAYVRSKNWIDSVVVGVETKEQLLDNLSLFSEPALNHVNDGVWQLPVFDESFLNPALWAKG